MSSRAPHSWIVLCALCSCATSRPEPVAARVPFRPYQLAPQPLEPFSESELRAARLANLKPSKDAPELPAIRIDASLLRFALDQRRSRFILKRGESMPRTVHASWTEMLSEVDKLLRQPAARVLPLDVVRARVALEAEIDMDRDQYMSLPDGLFAGVTARCQALEMRLVEIRRANRKAKLAAPDRLSWPVDPVIVTSLFGMRADPLNGEDRDHQGLDLKAEKGQLIQAAGEGTVIRAGPWGGYGLHAEIQHGDGLVTSYSHMSTLLVTEGAHVPAHGPVGLAGSTGRSTGPHLHFEVVRDGVAVDPLGELPDPAVEDTASASSR